MSIRATEFTPELPPHSMPTAQAVGPLRSLKNLIGLLLCTSLKKKLFVKYII